MTTPETPDAPSARAPDPAGEPLPPTEPAAENTDPTFPPTASPQDAGTDETDGTLRAQPPSVSLALDDEPDDSEPVPARRLPAVAALAIGLVVGVLAGAAFWAFGPIRGGTGTAASSAAAAPVASDRPGSCAWLDRTAAEFDVTGKTSVKVAVGRPAATGEHRHGAATLTVTTDRGPMVVAMDAGLTPCAVASLDYLAGKQFFTGEHCVNQSNLGWVACGGRDPDYTFVNENLDGYPRSLVVQSGVPDGAVPTDLVTIMPGSLPTDLISSLCPDSSCSLDFDPLDGPKTVEQTTYPAGTVLLASSGPGTNGGSFILCTKELQIPQDATAFGRVTSGLAALTTLGAQQQASMTSVTVTFG